MPKEFTQILWDEKLAEDCLRLARLAFEEDLEGQSDWTTVALVEPSSRGTASLVSREAIVVAGMPTIEIVRDAIQADFAIEAFAEDGQSVPAGATLATLRGRIRDLLVCERTMLNLLSRLVGIATQTRHYVERVQGTKARIYDTRKTTLGWRRLEKYAVRCGGARNHRMGLYDAILIKDNHLAQGTREANHSPQGAVQAVGRVREFLKSQGESISSETIVEIEVDSLEQLMAVLPAQPDLVLLDNMSSDELAQAVGVRDELAPQVELEASGGIGRDTIRQVALSGVDRISVGGLTHSVHSADIGLDWR